MFSRVHRGTLDGATLRPVNQLLLLLLLRAIAADTAHAARLGMRGIPLSEQYRGIKMTVIYATCLLTPLGVKN